MLYCDIALMGKEIFLSTIVFVTDSESRCISMDVEERKKIV